LSRFFTLGTKLLFFSLEIKNMSQSGSTQFIGQLMVTNIINGLKELPDMQGVHIVQGIICKRNDGSDMGDTDIFVEVDNMQPIMLKYILPLTNCIWNPKPIDKTFLTVHMEVKKTCDHNSISKNTVQFVKFFSELFESNRCEEPNNHPILFVFNGSDNIKVWESIKSKTNNGFIHGHPVFTVWVDSDYLSRWASEMQTEKREAEYERREAEYERRLAERERRVAELEAEKKAVQEKLEEAKDVIAHLTFSEKEG
jgi:hypothetical protein